MIEPPLEVSTGEINARPPRVGHRWFDLVVALSAICISVISLIVGVQHGRTERDLVEANSWPFVEVNKDFHANGSFELTLANAGVGPAKLQSFGLVYSGQPVPSIQQLVQICCANPGESQSDVMARLGGQWSWGDPNQRVVRPGQVVQVFSFTPPSDSTLARTKLRKALEALRFQGCYCSVFDNCFRSDLMNLKPAPVASCPAAPDMFQGPS